MTKILQPMTKLSKEQRPEVIAAYLAGEKPVRIASRFKISPAYVCNLGRAALVHRKWKSGATCEIINAPCPFENENECLCENASDRLRLGIDFLRAKRRRLEATSK